MLARRRHELPLLFAECRTTGQRREGLAAAGGNAVRGAALYRTLCAACHAIGDNGAAPAHRGVFGRKAGSRLDYAYSDAVRSSDVLWTEKTLARRLANPEKLIPGQRMGFMVASPADRADLIAYLKTQSEAARRLGCGATANALRNALGCTGATN